MYVHTCRYAKRKAKSYYVGTNLTSNEAGAPLVTALQYNKFVIAARTEPKRRSKRCLRRRFSKTPTGATQKEAVFERFFVAYCFVSRCLLPLRVGVVDPVALGWIPVSCNQL